MSRNIKTKKIDDQEFTIRELLVEEYVETFKIFENGFGIDQFKKFSDEIVPLACPELNFEKIKRMAPSDITEIYEVFKEVNAPFLLFARTVGMGDVVKGLRLQVIKNFLTLLSDSKQ